MLNSENCLSAVAGDLGIQHPNSYCNQGAVYTVLPSANKINGSKSSLGVISGIVGAVICGAVLAGFLGFMIFRKMRRRMSPTVMIGTLGLVPYQAFSIEDLEEAYKGWIRDGSSVIIRCLRLKHKLSCPSLLQYIDIVSKLRHRHSVSIVGYCVTSDGDNTMDTIFLVFKHISNGNLRSYLGGNREGKLSLALCKYVCDEIEGRNALLLAESKKIEMMMTSSQRVSATIGVAKGIQFLHTVTVPGIVGNDLNIENILLDQTLTAKIRNYNLPILSNFRSHKLGSRSPLSIPAREEDLGR
ncbi:hypothetical protein ZIOFF_003446 [Zingiber officinale]|uniref:Protein kinase domain-containing protein n=1 Tax=Zingiber officinale TaxID=94328 RepID=A0A8J5HXP9_ZINOF|nr:hypothetical protein ZIOFF_003446 [Zingiber officinale]